MYHRLVILFAALALVVAACGGSGGDQVASLDGSQSESPESTDDEATTQTDEEALLAFAACMRDNGVEDFEDPVVNSDGSVEFGFGGGGGGGGGQDGGGPFGGADQETVQGAFETCQGEIEGLAFGPGGGDFDTEEFQDTFVEFAACMRDQGIQMDDPDFTNLGPGQGGGGAGPFGDLDFDDPDVQAAMEVCQDVFGGTFPGLGGPGGGPGGGPPGGGAPPGGDNG